MLLHSKTLYRLYPEQIWLADLQNSGRYASRADQATERDASVSNPKFCKPHNTAYKLRQLQAPVEEQSTLVHLLTFLRLRRAA
jgi:hypothetical protein